MGRTGTGGKGCRSSNRRPKASRRVRRRLRTLAGIISWLTYRSTVTVTAFARQTGDIAVLSSADVRVLALAYDTEVEANGTWRLREKVGGKRNGKDPGKEAARLERRRTDGTEGKADRSGEREEADGHEVVEDEGDDLANGVAALNVHPRAEEEEADWSQVPVKSHPTVATESDDDDADSMASDSDPSWITPENVHLHKARDMGAFSPFAAASSSGSADPTVAHNLDSASTTASTRADGAPAIATGSTTSKGPPTMKAALLTGDYAMQNVGIQMGLNVLGVGGKRIRDVKTWVLRCYGCLKYASHAPSAPADGRRSDTGPDRICKDATRKFCPSCGGATLTRVSVTYTPSSPTGYVLHLKRNFQYRNRGTIYTIPSAKPGTASFEKGGARKQVNGAELVLREDQKEFQRGLRTAAIGKQKEEKREAKAAARGDDPFGGWRDPDWQPPMLLGEKGRRGGRGNDRGVRLGKDGLPVIGFGRNPNEVRKHR